ncbi:hypothetical protein [Deinococcus peraridilitoris]|uniref:Uncharacterized protein n=1 Tax=Deinococcus peraridilitoris (strain DSM 19664 / LMG 22246 / CIP 109416 / KR-200) TaxID=937777 RepID=L0A0T8_DEIPD|nr:hypothetical protein [Deinococcus peraridilitoris]AFZ66792.1 hypothetical protein Deipe_1242 [Deinococcus peraridilitoris DSM 19664]
MRTLADQRRAGDDPLDPHSLGAVLEVPTAEAEKIPGAGPLILLGASKPIEDCMRITHVDLPDILMAARSPEGLERLEQIKYAVPEEGNSISIIPRQTI